jgi:glycosyltransferase involved in cell wall biosynthesis
MDIAIIIPAHNEAQHIGKTLESLIQQSTSASRIIVVDDNSTDQTAEIVQGLESSRIELVWRSSAAENQPGSKVVKAFNYGLKNIVLSEYDVICKFDADLIFPVDYLKTIIEVFESHERVGMVGGHCTVEKNGQWAIENQNNPDHIRGALKAYRTECFKQIGGLKNSIGWDTADEMIARFYGWKVVTVPDLHVKHLKPTGAAYMNKSVKHQGEAMFKLRMGFLLTIITGFKMALKAKRLKVFTDYLSGYAFAKSKKTKPILTSEQGKFIRNYRWKGIKRKLGL